jgi:hypothetical protein
VPVRNISQGGINLRLAHRIDPGTILTMKLFNTRRRFECSLPVRIIYNLERPDGDFLVGGAFERELTENEVNGLL